MKRFFKSAAIFVWTSATALSFSGDSLHAYSGSFGPTVTVLVTRPTLQWEVWSPGSHVTRVEMRVDRRNVTPAYEPELRALVYVPALPLSPGAHSVDCKVTFDGESTFTKKWTTVVSKDAIPALPGPSEVQLSMLALLNRKRGELGLPEIQMDDRLNAAARAHLLYLAANGIFGHDESPRKLDFVGRTGADRCAAFGWCANSWEDVAFGERQSAFAIEHLFDAPYHRLPFMQPGKLYFGADHDGVRTVLEFGSGTEEGVVTSPPESSSGVPVSWECHEVPNPLRFHTTKTVCGYPVVIADFQNTLQPLTNVEASLQASNGEQVAIWVNTPDNDEDLTNAAVLIPQAPLKPNTEYIAKADFRIGGRPVFRTWCFKTGTGKG